MENLIISNLSKTYDNQVEALKNISLEIPLGIYGLLGPNGAGKSTLMRIIATLQDPDSGSIGLGKIDVLKEKTELRKVLGYLPQQFGVYPRVSAEMLLEHLAVLKGNIHRKQRKELIASLLQRVNLYDVRKRRLGTFSGGMKQRFGIAQALLNNPQLLIVDEPTAGLDPLERNRFYNLLSEVSENTIVILSTHIVSDVKELCSGMAILNRGKVMIKGNPHQLMSHLEGRLYKKTIDKKELDFHRTAYQVINERLYLGRPLIHILCDTNPGHKFTPAEANLEDLYMTHINPS